MTLTSDLRKLNEHKIIDLISVKGSSTKTELAEDTGLTIVTVNKVVNSLVEQGIVVENGIFQTHVGKKAVLYEINKNNNYILGLSVNANEIVLAISPLNLHTIHHTKTKIDNTISPEDFIEIIKNMIESSIDSTGLNLKQFVGIGVSLPGIIEYDSGNIKKLISMPNLHGFSLSNALSQEYNLPVFLEKDNYAAMLDLKRKYALNNENAVLLSIGQGLGCGVILDGEIYTGNNGLAGELGHITVVPGGLPCKCGNDGCLEMYLSNSAVIREIYDRINIGDDCVLKNLTDKVLTINDVLLGLKLDDKVCAEAVSHANDYFKTTINIITKSYDVSRVFIVCPWLSNSTKGAEYLNSFLNDRLYHMDTNTNINITLISDDRLYIDGIIALVYYNVINNIANNKLLKRGIHKTKDEIIKHAMAVSR